MDPRYIRYYITLIGLLLRKDCFITQGHDFYLESYNRRLIFLTLNFYEKRMQILQYL